MGTRSFARMAGVAGLVGVAFILAALALAFSGGYEREAWQRVDVGAILPAMHASTNLWVLSMWAFLLGNTLMVAFALGLQRVLPGSEGALGIAPWAVVLGVVIVHVDTLVMIGLVQGLAGAYAAASGAERASLEATALALVHLRNHAYLFGFGLLAAGMFLFGLRAVRPSPLPRWTGWTAMLGGAAIIVGSLWPLVALLGGLVDVGSAVLVLGFVLPASIALLRLRLEPEEAPEPPFAARWSTP